MCIFLYLFFLHRVSGAGAVWSCNLRQHRLFWNTEWQYLLCRKANPPSQSDVYWINTKQWNQVTAQQIVSAREPAIKLRIWHVCNMSMCKFLLYIMFFIVRVPLSVNLEGVLDVL